MISPYGGCPSHFSLTIKNERVSEILHFCPRLQVGCTRGFCYIYPVLQHTYECYQELYTAYTLMCHTFLYTAFTETDSRFPT